MPATEYNLKAILYHGYDTRHIMYWAVSAETKPI